MSSSVIRAIGLAAGLMVIALAATAVASDARRIPEVAGIVHIRNSAPAFHGNVGVENESCEGPRPVKMFERKRNGDRRLLGTTDSELNGHWEILVDPLASGAYFATAPRYEFTDIADQGWICLRAKSRTLVVD